MGHTVYSMSARTVRAKAMDYDHKAFDDIFVQNKEHRIHKEMNPNGITFRESCDSKEHPFTTPIQFYLDVTGSMGTIPHEMIKSGLPTLIGSLLQNGVPDVVLMFAGIGDHECDRAPLQVAQFESGDAELDMWLERLWIEGNGGGNAGESYLLAWYFAAFHTKTDAFEKRGQKGFVFTIGDEPCLPNLPMSAVKQIMGSSAVGQKNYTREELLEKAQEKNHVYHIFLTHNGRIDHDGSWAQMLGKNLIVLNDHALVSKTISDTILSHSEIVHTVPVTAEEVPHLL